MTTDRERMLAEGPRVAPEPRIPDGYEAVPVATEAVAAPRRRPARLLRFLPLAIPLVFLAVNVVGFGRYLGLAVVAAAIAALLVDVVAGLRK